jgi:hypothetical protein
MRFSSVQIKPTSWSVVHKDLIIPPGRIMASPPG